jgi:hypothetical protein
MYNTIMFYKTKVYVSTLCPDSVPLEFFKLHLLYTCVCVYVCVCVCISIYVRVCVFFSAKNCIYIFKIKFGPFTYFRGIVNIFV